MQTIYPQPSHPVPTYPFDAWHQFGGAHLHRTSDEKVGNYSTGPSFSIGRNSFDLKSSESRTHPTGNQLTYPEPPASRMPVPPYVADAYASGEKFLSPQEVEDWAGNSNCDCSTDAEDDDDDTFDCAVDCRCVFAEGEIDEYDVDVEMANDVAEEMIYDNPGYTSCDCCADDNNDDDDDFDCAVECRCVFADGEVDEYDVDGDDMAAYNGAIIVPRL